jgi:AraC-like DNA-binding protein
MATHPASENRVKIWRDAALPEAEFLSAMYVTHRFPAHEHNYYALGFVEAGAQEFVGARKRRFLMEAGALVTINPGDVHAGAAATDAGWGYKMICISPVDIARILEIDHDDQIRRLPAFDRPTVIDRETLDALRAMLDCSQSADASMLEKTSRLTYALNLLTQRHGNVGGGLSLASSVPGAVRRAREYIDSSFAENPSLEKIAEIAGLSASHLLPTFRNIVGMTPHAYLTQRRIAMARHLLTKGRALRTIAIETGYADQAHFSREFRRFYGVTPRASRP